MARGKVEYTLPSTPSQRGEVKISSVGMLGRYSTPSVVWAVAPAHTWPSGRRTFRSVPRELA